MAGASPVAAEMQSAIAPTAAIEGGSRLALGAGDSLRSGKIGSGICLHHFTQRELNNVRGLAEHFSVELTDPDIIEVPGGIIPNAAAAEKTLGVFDRDFGVVEASLDAERHRIYGKWRPGAGAMRTIRSDDRTAYYLGVGDGQYGHFLLETLSRAWAWESQNGDLVPVIQFGVPKVARGLYGLIPNLLESAAPLRHSMQFDRVIVPRAAFIIGHGAHVTFKSMCQRMAERALGASPQAQTDQPLYISRTRLDPASRHGLVGESRLERFLQSQGFAIAHPEEMPISEQIALFNRHKWLLTPMGSACHTRLFALGTTTLVMLAHPRFLRNFILCDALCEGEAHYLNVLSVPDIGVDVGQNFWEPFMLDEESALASLKAFGLVKPGANPEGPAPGLKDYATKWIAIARRQAERKPQIAKKLLRAIETLSASPRG